MGDSVKVFNKIYNNVSGVKAKSTSQTTLAYIRPQGTIEINENGTADVSEYASALINVPSQGTDTYFYVYRPSNCTIEKIEIQSDPEWVYDLTQCVSAGYMYGGYSSKYTGASQEFTQQDLEALTFTEVDGRLIYNDSEGTVFDGSVASAFGNATYHYRESGASLSPTEGSIYYLKEIPDTYFRPAVVHITQTNGTISDIGIKVLLYDGAVEGVKFGEYSGTKNGGSAITGFVNANGVSTSVSAENFNTYAFGGTVDDIPRAGLGSSINGTTTGTDGNFTNYISRVGLQANQTITITPSYRTYDSLEVFSKTSVVINTGNLTIVAGQNGEYISPGITFSYTAYQGDPISLASPALLSTTVVTPSAERQIVTPANRYGDGFNGIVVNPIPSISLQSKTATPTESVQTITADSGYDALSSVEIGAISSTYIGSGVTQISSNTGIAISGNTVTVTGQAYYTQNVSKQIPLQSKSVTPSETAQTVTPDAGNSGLSSVSVGAISSTYVGSGITQRDDSDVDITGNAVTVPAGYYDEDVEATIGSASFQSPSISVSSSGLISSSTAITSAGYIGAQTISGTQQLTTQAAKTVAPTESEQTAVAANVYTTGIVKVGAISSTYVGSGIAQRTGSDLTASGATVTVPAGYYGSQQTKSVATTTHPNPTASINTSTGLITASHTQTAGYVTAGTTTGTTQLNTQAAKTVTPTESEQTAVAANVYTTGIVKVGAISSTYVGSGIAQGSSSTVSVNATNNTISVAAGYYSSAVNTSMGTASINTTTSGVTVDSNNVAHGSLVVSTGGYISAGTYTTTQGIQIQKYYTGSGNPSSSTGNNGDLYFKVVS